MHKILRHLFPAMPERNIPHLWRSLAPQESHYNSDIKPPTPQRKQSAAICATCTEEQLGAQSAPQTRPVDDAANVLDVIRSKEDAEEVAEFLADANSVMNRARPMTAVRTQPNEPARTRPAGGGGGGPWRVSSPALGKRGPECMRKCIAQGVLHPVQCHSLC